MGLIQKVASKGILYSFGILFNRIVPEWLFRCRRFVILEMNSPIPGVQDVPGLDVRWCESDSDFSAVARLTEFNPISKDFAEDFEGKACIAEIDGKPVAGFWYATHSFGERDLGIQYRLDPGQAWLFSAKVDNDFRNRGIHQEVMRFMLNGLYQQEIQHSFLAVNPNNKPSMHVHLKYSRGTVGKVFVIRLLGIAACWPSGSCVQCSSRIAFNTGQNPVSLVLAPIPSDKD